MLTYIARRLLLMIPTLIIISVLIYIVIELPPGDFVSTRVSELEEEGEYSAEALANLRHQYGLDRPAFVRYWMWASKFIRGDFGYSLAWHKPVRELLWARFGMTALLSVLSLLFTWALAFPIGIYSAVYKYSFADVNIRGSQGGFWASQQSKF